MAWERLRRRRRRARSKCAHQRTCSKGSLGNCDRVTSAKVEAKGEPALAWPSSSSSARSAAPEERVSEAIVKRDCNSAKSSSGGAGSGGRAASSLGCWCWLRDGRPGTPLSKRSAASGKSRLKLTDWGSGLASTGTDSSAASRPSSIVWRIFCCSCSCRCSSLRACWAARPITCSTVNREQERLTKLCRRRWKVSRRSGESWL